MKIFCGILYTLLVISYPAYFVITNNAVGFQGALMGYGITGAALLIIWFWIELLKKTK